MRTSLILFFRLISISSFAQEKVDSLKQFKYLYFGEPMPFDSGVAISDKQYSYLLKQSIYRDLDSRVSSALKPVPKIVYETKEIRKKGDGNKLVWFLSGTTAGIVVTTIISVFIKK